MIGKGDIIVWMVQRILEEIIKPEPITEFLSNVNPKKSLRDICD
jgi:hypothetical protein